jgi:hypothetical protein
MSNENDPIGRGSRDTKGWMLCVTHNVISTGNTEVRRPGSRRLGVHDRRLSARTEPSERRTAERRDT